MSLTFRWRIRLGLLLIFAVGIVGYVAELRARTPPPHLGPWCDCRRDSTVVCDGLQFTLEQARWRGQKLECEYCVTNVEKRHDVWLSTRPWFTLYCEFHDKKGRKIEPLEFNEFFLSKAVLLGDFDRQRCWFAVPVPPTARSVAVGVGRGNKWVTRPVKLPPKKGLIPGWLLPV